MNNNLDLNDVINKANNLAKETKSSIDIQMEKVGVDKAFKKVNEVFEETMKSIAKEFKTPDPNSFKEGESSPIKESPIKESPIKEKIKQGYNSIINEIKKEQKVKLLIKKIPSASAGGVLFIVFGSIGILLWGITVIGALLFSGLFGITIFGFLSAGMLLGSVLMLVIGIQKIKKLTRFKRYCQRIGDTFFCEIQLLMDDVGKRKKTVIKDLNKMRTEGYIKDLYFDKKKQNVMLNREMYQLYEESLKSKLIEADQLRDEVLRETNENSKENQSEEERILKEVLEKGQLQLLEIKSFNALIEGSSIF